MLAALGVGEEECGEPGGAIETPPVGRPFESGYFHPQAKRRLGVGAWGMLFVAARRRDKTVEGWCVLREMVGLVKAVTK
jgi:hypothetical protein